MWSRPGSSADVFAIVIDSDYEAIQRFSDRLEHVHEVLADAVVVLGPRLGVAGAGGNGVDEDQAERHPEFLLQRSIRLFSHRQQRLNGAFPQQHRSCLVPAERGSLHAPALGLHDGIEERRGNGCGRNQIL